MEFQTYNIVNERPRTIRALARQALQGRWTEAFVLLLVVTAIEQVPGTIINSIAREGSILGFIASIYSLLIAGPLAMGVASSMTNAAYAIALKEATDVRKIHPLTIQLYTAIIGMIVMLPFADYGVIADFVAQSPLSGSLFLLAHATVASLLPNLLFAIAFMFIAIPITLKYPPIVPKIDKNLVPAKLLINVEIASTPK